MDRPRTNVPSGLEDRDSWSEELKTVYTSSAESLTRLAAVLLGRRSEAEEVVHDAFVAVSTHAAEIENVGAYVRRSVVNGSYGVLRRRQLVERHHQAHELDAPPNEAPGYLVEFRDVLMGLSLNQRTVIVLRHLEGLSVRETAEVLGCRESTVRSHARRGLKRLRKELSP